MGTTFKAYLMAGVRLERFRKPEVQTRYHETTGRPYEKTVYVAYYRDANNGTELPQEMYSQIREHEVEGLEVRLDHDQDYAVVGRVLATVDLVYGPNVEEPKIGIPDEVTTWAKERGLQTGIFLVGYAS